jgi:hypothetical protein
MGRSDPGGRRRITPEEIATIRRLHEYRPPDGSRLTNRTIAQRVGWDERTVTKVIKGSSKEVSSDK